MQPRVEALRRIQNSDVIAASSSLEWSVNQGGGRGPTQQHQQRRSASGLYPSGLHAIAGLKAMPCGFHQLDATGGQGLLPKIQP